ncbi:MAG: TPM domain-containing protein [Lachnospiraceae bacterium]|nr:TPM domain-containing protein [Lachnospiraceae bacterium]
MAHRSGGGSHSGGHHSGGHHSSSHGGSGGGNAARYSNRPFPNARRFRYYDRRGRERYLYGSRMPQKSSRFSLIFSLVFFTPFFLAGIFSVVSFFLSFASPRPLRPDYEPTDVHIMDGAGVIDDEDSLEEILQEFEDTTGISPYVITVYDEDWKYYDELWNYAYEIYINSFLDEQHFLIVYSEPENAEELDFVDWSWEGIQGDDTDRILTESNIERFGDDLHDNLLRNNVSVGEAFEKAFKKSLTYMMKGGSNEDTMSWLLFSIVWNTFVIFAISGIIRSYIIGKRDYQEVPTGVSANTVPGAMGYGNQNNTTFYDGSNPQNGQMYQSGQIYQSDGARYRKYMYYDKNGNKKYTTCTGEPKTTAFAIMVIVLIITVPMLFFGAVALIGLIAVVNTSRDSQLIPFIIGVAIYSVVVITGMVCAIRHYKNVKNRQYIDVTKDESVNYGSGMQNNNASQYNAAGAADANYYNDEARFRSPEYYDDDARYRGSTAYEAGKK